MSSIGRNGDRLEIIVIFGPMADFLEHPGMFQNSGTSRDPSGTFWDIDDDVVDVVFQRAQRAFTWSSSGSGGTNGIILAGTEHSFILQACSRILEHALPVS